MKESFNAVWKPPTVGDLQMQIDEQNKLIDALREQIKEQHEKLRDRFAMAALTGMLAHGGQYDVPASGAKEAYLYADALIAERGKK